MKRSCCLFPKALIFVVSLCLTTSNCYADDAEKIYDPLEPMNRAVFWFNDQLDVFLLEPVAKGYDFIVPSMIQTGIGNFFTNIRYPQYLLSDIIQLKFDQVGTHTGRFLINSVFGLAGFIDVAHYYGVDHHQEDFGLALAYRGVPGGWYCVLPILGPSNMRDILGIVVDRAISPLTYINYTSEPDSTKYAVSIGLTAIETIDTRANLLDAVKASKESALDYYLFVQSAYYQHRTALLYDGEPPEFEDDFFEEYLEEERE